MTRYRAPVADPILLEREFWTAVEGFRLVSVDGPWLTHPHVTICTFDDDNAPPELEGEFVEPEFTMTTAGCAEITGRRVIGGTP